MDPFRPCQGLLGGVGNRGDRGNDAGLGMHWSLKISISETRNQARWAGEKPSQVGGETKPGGGRNQARNRADRGNDAGLGMHWTQVGRGETKPGGPGEQGGQGQRRGFGHALEPKDFTLRDKKRWAGEKGTGGTGATTRVWACIGAAKDFTLRDKKPGQAGRGETKPGGRGEQGGQGQRRGFGHALEPRKISLSRQETKPGGPGRNQARWAGEKPSQVGGGNDAGLGTHWKTRQVGWGENKTGGPGRNQARWAGGTGGTGATTRVWAWSR